MTEISADTSKSGILVFLEKKDGKLSNISLEVLTGAGRLAEKACCEINSIILEDGFEDFYPKTFADEIISAVQNAKPELILMGATTSSSGIGAILSSELNAGIVSDCIDIKYSEKMGFCPVRPDPSGSVRQIMTGEAPIIVSVRPGTFEAAEELLDMPMTLAVISGSKHGQKDRAGSHCGCGEEAIELINTILEKKHNADISKARILVSGGRGIGGEEGFAQLRILADLLGGEVACSRACIEAGWADSSMQVGQTGKTVHPELYIACGISGAIQHVTGMKDAGLIIAINKNPAAPIFDIADLGIVGNLENILPVLIKSLQEKKGDTNAI